MQKIIIYLLIIGLIYFCLFIPFNGAGAQNPEMLSVFEIDEYAQFPNLQPMLSGGESLKYTIRNFLVYQHYFYGYPFYFFSSLVALPFRLINGPDFLSQTRPLMLALRQLINVLPNMLAAFVLTYFATRFRSLFSSLIVFSIILFTPALVANGLWWHPDGLGLLFIALTMFFLSLDNLRLKKFFYFAAISAGIAGGIKYLGFFFVLTIPTYLIFGLIQKKYGFKKMVLSGFVFIVIMFAAIIITNPLLLLPLERSEIIRIQTSQFIHTSSGEMLGKQPLLEEGRLPGWLIANYGTPFFILLLFISLISGFFQKKNRLNAIIIATFIIPQIITTLAVALRRSHYFLPIFLPLTASLSFLIPDNMQGVDMKRKENFRLIPIIAILLIQALFFIREDYFLFLNMKNREKNSSSIAFYHEIAESYFDPLPTEPITIYRDWHVYFPENNEVDVFMDWDLASYQMLDTEKPDYLLLDNAYISTYGAPGFLDISSSPERLAEMHQFYSEAFEKDIIGYSLIFENSFGSLYERNMK